MMREETDEEIVREAIGVAEDEGYTELYQDAIAALDRLVAERDAAVGRANAAEYARRKDNEYLVARAEAAEKERDEALAANEAAKQFSYASHRRRAEAAGARCATLEAALRTVRDNIGVPQDSLTPAPLAYAYEVACEALAAASQPAEPLQFGAGVTSLAANLPPVRVESLLDDDDFAVLDEASQPAEET